MNRNATDYILSRNMIAPGDHVIAAVSGGKDSMALLHFLGTLAEEWGFTLSAAHFNHNLRGEESAGDEAFVRAYCDSHNIPLSVGQGDVAGFSAEKGLSLEEAARVLRYQFLLSLSTEAKIATAHTAGDNTETILMHLVRGTGLKGLTGIPPVRDRIIRPLLLCTPTQILSYLEQHHIPYVTDSTNSSDFCLRNRVRHHVIPLLLQENPALDATMAATAQLLREEEEYLSQEAERHLQSCSRPQGLSVEALRSLHPAMQRRVLKLFLSPVAELSLNHIDDGLKLLSSDNPSARLCLPGHFSLQREYALLVLRSGEAEPIPAPAFLSPGQTIRFGRYALTLNEGICPEQLPENTLALDISGPLLIRTRLPGDTIRLSGGEKKLKKHLIDRKIPARQRDYLPVAVKDNTIVALPPLTAAWPYGAKRGKPSLILTVKELEDTPS